MALFDHVGSDERAALDSRSQACRVSFRMMTMMMMIERNAGVVGHADRNDKDEKEVEVVLPRSLTARADVALPRAKIAFLLRAYFSHSVLALTPQTQSPYFFPG